MPFARIRWGSNPADDVEQINYTFDSHAQRDSFLDGVEAASGWLDYEIVASDADPDTNDAGYCCEKCGSGNVEACLPAFFDANLNFEYRSFDVDAETLFWFCNDCSETVAVVKPTGEIEHGRWS